MSLKSSEKTKCPDCGTEIEFTLWESLNSSLDPDESRKLRRCVWSLRIPQFGHEKCPPRWGILLASKNPFIPVNMLVAPSDSSVSLQPA